MHRSNCASFNHLVGAGEQDGRDGEAECSCRLEVNHKLKFRRLLDRQIRRLCSSPIKADDQARASPAPRLAIFAIVARLQPVAFWIVVQETLFASMSAMPSLRSTSSFRPL
jgi:hypothetical protein